MLAQTEDQYPFSTVYDQELLFYSFKQETLSNPQWYERFNTKVDVSEEIGVTRQHKVLLDYVAQESYTKSVEGLGVAEQKLVRDNAEERYVLYAFLRQSGIQHGNLKVDLQNDFTTRDNRYPNNRQQMLHLLDKYSKTVIPKVTHSEGAFCAQKGGRGSGRRYNGNGKGHESSTYDKKYWKDKEYYKCHKMGNPATHCSKKSNSNDDDDSSAAATVNSVKKLQKDIKYMRKAFTTVNTQLKKLKEAESDISESEGEDEASHFQMDVALQFAQFEKEFEPRIAKLFKQAGSNIKLDLREIILLDGQSTMDLFCNAALVSKTSKSKSSMRLKSNGGTMAVSRKATLPGYNKSVWFSTRAITDIITLRNLIEQYRVTYDSDDFIFVVHRQSESKPNMEFRMHKSGLQYHDPRKEAHLTFINTVCENKEGFTQRHIKGADLARNLYKTLSYLSMKDFKWVIQSNQINDCPVTFQYIDVAQKIWVKNIAALKGKTTRSKSIPVARDYVKVPMELMKLHKEVFLTTNIFFVNKIPFFLTLSRKICFTAITHLADRTVPHIFKAFKEMYQYYLHHGFHINTVHADGEFTPLKPLIESMPGGPMVNLASANEHVPEIERRIWVVMERCRKTRHILPYERIPKLVTIHIVLNVVKLLNFFPTKDGVSDTLSHKTIMSGETLDFKKHLSLQIGQCCQVHEEDTHRNSRDARTKGAISLGPSGNIQGGFKFMALNSGNKIVRRSWDVISLPDVVINRVNELGKDQPHLVTFTDRHGRLIGDMEIPGVDSTKDEDGYFPGVDPVIADAIEIPGVDVAGPEALDEVLAPQIEIYDPDDIPHDDPAPIEVVPAQAVPVPAPVAPPAETGFRRSTRVRTQASQGYIPSMEGSKYSYALTQLESQGVLNPDAHMFTQDYFYQVEPAVVADIMTQLLLKAGLK
jgi:hypothetical protein